MKMFISLQLIFMHIFSCIQASTILQPESLLNQTWKIYSQSGEEGIIDQILQKLNIEEGVFVEFGALDGMYLSNTRFLAERGWKGAWIESNSEVIAELKKNAEIFPEVISIHEFVSTMTPEDSSRSLDEILDAYNFKDEIDLLSIDIDGLDYLIFENLQRKPKVICIESSGYWHPLLDQPVPWQVAACNLGQPLSVMIDIAKKKGYEPICFLTVNLFLVRKDLYAPFSNIKNDPITLWAESWRYMGANSPIHQNYISNRRVTDNLMKIYDTLPTPSQDAAELLGY